MTETPTRRTVLRSTLFLLVAGVVAFQACIVESPILVGDDQEGEASEAAVPEVDIPPPPSEALDRVGAASQGETRGKPSFTPFTVAPRIVNRAEVVEAMQREYPPLLRDAGIGGTVAVYFFVDEKGAVGDVRISESSGHEALDRAALAVADVFRFTPASNDDKPTAVWVSFPITFEAH